MRLAPLALAGLGLGVWANAVGTPFVFDDDISVVQNPSIRTLWPPWGALIPPARRVMAGRPLANLTLAVNYALGGLDPRGYHLLNLALHVCAGCVLLGIVRRTLTGPRLGPRFGGSAETLALASAAIWLVHPLQTDAVTYVTQRTELLMGLFVLLTVYAALRAWDESHARLWAAGSVVCSALGMASKEVGAVAPVLVLLYDHAVVGAPWPEIRRRRAGLYLGLVASWAVIVALLVLTPRTETIGLETGVTPLQYAGTELGVIVRYLGLSLWPASLCLDYGGWIARGMVAVALPGVVVGFLLAGTAWALWRRRPVGFLGAWFFVVLAPTSSVVPIATEVMAERRMYLPLAAVVVLAVVGAAALAGRRPRRLLAGVALVLVAALATVSVRRNRVYASELGMLADTVAKRPDNPRARNNFGSSLLDAGRVEEARVQLTEAVRLEPAFADPHYNLGIAFADEGRQSEAIAEFKAALRLDPTHVPAYVGLGSALLDLGRLDEAVGLYRAALQLDPAFAPAHNNLGVALREQGRLGEAAGEFAVAVRLDPSSEEMRENLRDVQARLGSGG